MSRPSNNPYAGPVRPAFAPLQTTSNSQTSSYSSTSSLASQSSTSSVPLNSPTATQPQRPFGSIDQRTQQQSQQQYQQPPAPQRHPSFEYRPNRDGAGTTAAETTNYLNQMALLNEAAKRAQMAVVMRDLDGMEL